MLVALCAKYSHASLVTIGYCMDALVLVSSVSATRYPYSYKNILLFACVQVYILQVVPIGLAF